MSNESLCFLDSVKEFNISVFCSSDTLTLSYAPVSFISVSIHLWYTGTFRQKFKTGFEIPSVTFFPLYSPTSNVVDVFLSW